MIIKIRSFILLKILNIWNNYFRFSFRRDLKSILLCKRVKCRPLPIKVHIQKCRGWLTLWNPIARRGNPANSWWVRENRISSIFFFRLGKSKWVRQIVHHCLLVKTYMCTKLKLIFSTSPVLSVCLVLNVFNKVSFLLGQHLIKVEDSLR
jgi:hypothetical protein